MLRISLAQINPTVGAIKKNSEKIKKYYEQAIEEATNLVVYPELALCGYPADDLLLRKDMIQACEEQIKEIALLTEMSAPILLGAPVIEMSKTYNAVLLLKDGEIKQKFYKKDLPNYGVFDEERYFEPGEERQILEIGGARIGLIICEELWEKNIAEELSNQKIDFFLCINASPFEVHKDTQRFELAHKYALKAGVPFYYINQVGGQDDLVFDGNSFVLDQNGETVHESPLWIEDLSTIDPDLKPMTPITPTWEEKTWGALCTAVRDYVRKSGFHEVTLGLSGGVDSAMVATIAADALGPEHVHAVMMPSPYTSQESLDDAENLAKNLGISYETHEITPAMKAFDKIFKKKFEGQVIDETEENLQSRLRGTLIMALSNKFKRLVLSCGNKSEYATGYATLYGDMCGAFAPIKDIYKTDLYKLAHWVNTAKERLVIPTNIITKAPTAELRPGQKDSDSLPPYDVLDQILYHLIEEQKSLEDLFEKDFKKEDVLKVNHLLHINEYKRRQSPPGPKITSLSFTRERRYPIVNGRGWE